MAYATKTYPQILQDLRNSVFTATNVQVLPNSLTDILVRAIAKEIRLQYEYLDNTALEGTPWTSTDNVLDGWGALKGITRKTPSLATGTITFTGTAGTTIPADTVLVRNDGTQYTTNTQATVGTAVGITASASGTASNTAIGQSLSLQTSISGVNLTTTLTTAITGGDDPESDTDLRVCVLDAFASKATGGSVSDYENWTLAIPGFEQAWANPTPISSTGTLGGDVNSRAVVVYAMADRSNAYGGYLQGTNGAATDETRYTTATGDQLTIANALYPQRPVTSIVVVCSPIASSQDIVISGLNNLNSTQQSNISSAIESLFQQVGTPLGTTIYTTSIINAIQSVVNTSNFQLVSPGNTIELGLGYLPELGTTSFN